VQWYGHIRLELRGFCLFSVGAPVLGWRATEIEEKLDRILCEGHVAWDGMEDGPCLITVFICSIWRHIKVIVPHYKG
jgi:hypothetical protein